MSPAPFTVAVMKTRVVAETAAVLIGKTAELAPAATVTLAGTLATAGLLLDKVTVVAAAAVPLSVTVPWLAPPPVTGLGKKNMVGGHCES